MSVSFRTEAHVLGDLIPKFEDNDLIGKCRPLIARHGDGEHGVMETEDSTVLRFDKTSAKRPDFSKRALVHNDF